ncbi:hypothetical protein [Zobellia russellii]|uniref:hypothetical protein n=1 Tax=Zobellia russellii TaxID=248907 RepID=UPI0037DD41D9
MKKFITKFSIYAFLIFLLAEIISRFFYLTPEIPNRKIWKNGIQKYLPHQTGYWKGGKHKWRINNDGWPGQEINLNGSKILIIGDSFIENFMNPDECRQSYFLNKMVRNYNFIEFGRSGISFIEALEVNKANMKRIPNIHLSLIYISDNDLTESISLIKRRKDITQVDLQKNKVLPSELKSPLAKKILYKLKFIYYLYSKFPLNELFSRKKSSTSPLQQESDFSKEFLSLIEFTKKNYNLNQTVFILRPETSEEVLNIFKENEMKFVKLNYPNSKSWSFENDHHWTCYGHKEAAFQVSRYLKATSTN